MNKKEITENPAIGEKISRIIHRSGLDIYVINKDFAEYSAVLGTRYGSCDTTLSLPGEEKIIHIPAGTAHFLEHKMFESPDGADVSAEFAALGADANAYTSSDTTVYLFSCTEHFYEALEILIKMVLLTPHFTPENVRKEQGIIAEEIRMCQDSASEALYYMLMRAMYGEHAASVPIAGTVGSVSKITPELLYACYNTYYRPSNMVLSVCGRVDPDEVERIVDKMLPETEIFPVASDPDTAAAESQVCVLPRISREMEVSIPLFRLGIKYPEGGTDAVCGVLSEILFGECEEFYCGLYDKGLLSENYSYGYACRRGSSYFAAGGDSDDPEAVFDAFCAYAENIRKNGVSPEALERAKRVLYSDALKEFDSTESIAESVFDYTIIGADPLGRCNAYMSVNTEEVNGLAGKILIPERFALSVVYPKGDNGHMKSDLH